MRPLPLVVRYAERYQAHGLSLLKTAPGHKHPAYARWNRPENAISPRHWLAHPADGIAALLAPSNLVSIDVDEEILADRIMRAFDVDLPALRMTSPCIVGRHYRLMYRAPSVELKHRSVKWPKKDDLHSSSVILEFRAGRVSDTLPPTIHPGTGQPYRWENPPRNGFPPLPQRLLELWLDWTEFSRQTLELCPWAPAPPPAVLPRAPTKVPEGGSVIDVFNATYDIAAILEEHGYKRSGVRFASPDTDHSAGIVLIERGRVFCHHAGDSLSSEHAHDAFDVYRILQHGGNFRSAVKAAAEALGLKRRSAGATSHNYFNT